ncbi:MAG: AraC family transcriptional regulator [Erysipelotrichaceae bacterium]|nr:AraC family transcriptional regulator [Erysipelotrichaceae bacterium]
MIINEFNTDSYLDSFDYKFLIVTSPSAFKIGNDMIYPKKYDIIFTYKTPKIEIVNIDAKLYSFKNEFCKKYFLQNFTNYPIIYDFFSLNSKSPEYLYFKTSNSKEIQELIEITFKNDEEFIILNLLNIIFAKLGKEHTTLLSKIESSMLKEHLLGSIIKYIDENSKHITLEEVAKTFGYHPAYFSKFFKKYMKTSFKDMLKEIRLEKAIKYISETNFSIKTISKEVGYDDVNHFYKVFKDKYKCTPKNYKK